MDPAELNRVAKAQRVRLFDVFIIGPLMTVGGFSLARSGHPLLGLVLGVLGFSTVVYNAGNYGRIEERRAHVSGHSLP